jgi:PAS domain S-box-containing protein
MKTDPRKILRACAIALASTLVAIVLRSVMTPFAPKNVTFLFFVIALIVAGRYGGQLAAWLTLALTTIPATYLRSGDPDFYSQKSLMAMAIFYVTAVILVLLTKSEYAARQAAVRLSDEALERHRLLEQEIEDRKAAEQELRERQQELELALEGGRLGIWSWDMRTNRIQSSETQAIINGRSPHLTDMQFDDSLSNVLPEDRHLVREAIERAIRHEAPDRTIYRVRWPDGSIHWIEAIGRVFFDDAGTPIRAAGVCADITERRNDAEALEAERQLLRNLLIVQENEKTLICYEVHDGLVQYAAGALLLLESYAPGQSPANDREALDEAIDSLRRAVDEGRRVIRGVRPTVLDDSGVVAGIDDLVDQMSRPGLAVEFTPDREIQRLPKAIETTIYRVAQEALANARRHSGTDRVQIDLRRINGDVHLEVRDFGCGFNPLQTRPNAFGLRGMRERVRLLGGECAIESTINAGTRVVATLPVHANGDDDE